MALSLYIYIYTIDNEIMKKKVFWYNVWNKNAVLTNIWPKNEPNVGKYLIADLLGYGSSHRIPLDMDG